ncbi:hypothetical protein HRR86_007930 [Exophiala dermatitidis]|nr:hypothetical protein HRR86_007930 [Exophiala dermatitidis]
MKKQKCSGDKEFTPSFSSRDRVQENRFINNHRFKLIYQVVHNAPLLGYGARGPNRGKEVQPKVTSKASNTVSMKPSLFSLRSFH